MVSVSVEQLHDIDDEGATREGIRWWSKDGSYEVRARRRRGGRPDVAVARLPRSPRDAFEQLWSEVYGPGAGREPVGLAGGVHAGGGRAMIDEGSGAGGGGGLRRRGYDALDDGECGQRGGCVRARRSSAGRWGRDAPRAARGA